VLENNDKTLHDQKGFFGRKAELEILNCAFRNVTGGRVQAVFVTGEPGIGKTRLAEEFARFAESNGALVAWGKWQDGEQMAEFGVWKKILRCVLQSCDLFRQELGLDSALAELSSLLPEIRDTIPGLETTLGNRNKDGGPRLFDAIYRVLQHAAKLQPLVLIFDNIHLAVEASLEPLKGLFNELAGSSLLVIAAYSDLPVYRTAAFLSFLSYMKCEINAAECRLGNFEEADVTALLNDALVQRVSPLLVRKVFRLTKGNPLFVREIAKLTCPRPGNHAPTGDRWESEIQNEMSVIIAPRLNQLSKFCAYILQQAAVIGETFSLEELSMLFPQSGDVSLDEVITEAVGYGFLRRGENQGEHHFPNAVIHRTILSQLPPGERHLICRQLATRVENAFSQNLKPWTRKLAHWYSHVSSNEGRIKHRTYARLAAEAAMEESAWEEAISIFEKIINPSLTVKNDWEADALLGMGKAYFLSGERITGMHILQKSFAYYKNHGCIGRMIEIATHTSYIKTGEPGFQNLFEDVLGVVPRGTVTEGMVLHFYGVAQFLSIGDYTGAEKNLLRSCEIGEREGDRRLTARALCALAYLDNRFHRFDLAIQRLHRVFQLLEYAEDSFSVYHANTAMYEACNALGDHDAARYWRDECLTSALKTHDADFIAVARYILAKSLVTEGSWEEARRELEEGLRLNPNNAILLASLCNMEYAIGDFDSGDKTRAEIRVLQQKTPPGPYYAHTLAVTVEVVRSLNSGDSRGLKEHIAALRSITAHPHAVPFIRLRARLLLAFVAYLTWDSPLARELYKDIVESENYYLIRPYHKERILGLAARCFGDFESSLRHLRTALGESEKYCDKPLQAWILCELGEILLARKKDPGDITEGREKYLEAQTWAKTLHMSPLEQRVQNKLAFFEHIAQSGKIGTFILTGREREVLQFLAQGFSNASIAGRLNISRYTVINHVRNILDKTASRNRTEAVAAAQKVGLL
jgi:DNA-binding CsgD family transcriptional regulator/tetratricopeptide (TPR) repeat protein